MFRTELPKPILALKKINFLFSQDNGAVYLKIDKDSCLDFEFCGAHSSFFLESGVISLYHKDDDKHLVSISYPFCIGLTRIFHTNSKYYMKAETDVSVTVIDNAKLISI